MNKENLTYSKAFAFAVSIVRAYDFLAKHRKEFILSRQLLKSGTSIGANVAEAHGAVSRRDFSNKMAIAYKECLETKYWLDLLFTTGYIRENAFRSIYDDADELGRILFTIVRKTRNDR